MNEVKKIPAEITERLLVSLFKTDHSVGIDRLPSARDYVSEYRCTYRVGSIFVTAHLGIEYVPSHRLPLKVTIIPETIYYDRVNWPGEMFKERRFAVEPERFNEVLDLVISRTAEEEYERFFKVVHVYRELSWEDLKMLVKLSNSK